jgi:hypothetical protein
VSSLSEDSRPERGSDAGSALARRRDAVLRRWLGMEVERSSVGDLAERPLSARLRELEELFDAAVHELRSGSADGGEQLYEELSRALERQQSIGVPFTLALLGAPSTDASGWLAAVSEASEEGTRVVNAGDGTAAAILPGVRPAEADAAVDRLRALAWSSTGCHGRLPTAGMASSPQDGETPEELMGVAQDALRRLTPGDADRPRLEHSAADASVTPLYPELS